MTKEENTQNKYSVRLNKAMDDLNKISMMVPRSQYMYRLMDTVIFQDFETALDGIIEDFHAANDNQQ